MRDRYPITFDDNSQELAAKLAQHRARAWQVAREAAAILKERFAARRVVVFGSLVQPGRFTIWSDLDLAAWGIPPDRFFRAVSAMIDLSPHLEIDLVDPEDCSPLIQEAIRKEGVPL